jgi:magnesium-transporting ATPase (P-type)
LFFGGFLNFKNPLREETTTVLRDLDEGGISTSMITGDSVLTGIHIARQSGMIRNNTGVVFLGQCTEENSVEWVDVDDSGSILATESILKAVVETKAELAISGQAWSILRVRDPVLAHRIAKHIRVFGRCSPSDKVSIVSNFNEQGNVTLMCGDGQNDCGALRTAHVGIALSASEASVVAPLTSLDKTIASVSYVVREGRCALASTLAAYSFYLVYGQTETFLQTIASYFAILFFEWNWLFLDCVWTISLAFSIPLAKAAAKLSRRWPTSSLLGDETLVSICGIIAVNFLFMIGALITLWNQDWFKCRKWDPDGIGGVFIIGDNYIRGVGPLSYGRIPVRGVGDGAELWIYLSAELVEKLHLCTLCLDVVLFHLFHDRLSFVVFLYCSSKL